MFTHEILSVASDPSSVSVANNLQFHKVNSVGVNLGLLLGSRRRVLILCIFPQEKEF